MTQTFLSPAEIRRSSCESSVESAAEIGGAFSFAIGADGIEPSLGDPKSPVLPLDDAPSVTKTVQNAAAQSCKLLSDNSITNDCLMLQRNQTRHAHPVIPKVATGTRKTKPASFGAPTVTLTVTVPDCLTRTAPVVEGVFG